MYMTIEPHDHLLRLCVFFDPASTKLWVIGSNDRFGKIYCVERDELDWGGPHWGRAGFVIYGS
jgi:hypothetical protein